MKIPHFSVFAALLLVAPSLLPGKTGNTVLADAPPSERSFHPGTGEQSAEEWNEILERLEWRSTLSIGGKLAFSLFDPQQKTSYWLPLEESDLPLRVEAFDEEAQIVSLRHGETTRRLGMAGAQVTDMPADDPGNDIAQPVRLIPPSAKEKNEGADAETEDIPTVPMIPPAGDEDMF